MKNLNTNNDWYVEYRRQAQKQPTSPYKVVRIEHDVGIPISGLEDARVEAYSASQARALFLQKYPRLRDYQGMGWTIEAELDNEALRQRKQVNEAFHLQEEENIQNAWWNND